MNRGKEQIQQTKRELIGKAKHRQKIYEGLFYKKEGENRSRV